MTEPTLTLAVKANPAVAFAVLHEDPDLIVVDKPAGLVTQPGKGHATDTLLNGLFARHGKLLHNLGVRRDFGLLHRLDKDTSGVLVIAKSPNAYDQLRRDFEARKVDKEYLCVTEGTPAPKQGVVQARLKEIQTPTGDYSSIKKVVISRQGQEAVSAYKVVSTTADAALVRVNIKTGRLHQIRAHMMFLNTPIAGDELYRMPGKKSALPRPPRLCLHAERLGFRHPTTGEWVHFVAPLPADLAAYARRLGLGVA